MKNPLRAFSVLLISAMACAAPQPRSLDPTPTPFPTEQGTANPPEDGTPPHQPPIEMPENISFSAVGTLAMVGLDGNIYLASKVDGLVAATTDAAAARQIPATIAYSHPTWSKDGWLSFVRTDTVAPIPSISVQAIHRGLGEPRQLLKTSESNYIYGYWSPESSCTAGTECGRLAYLMSGGTSIELHLASVSTDLAADAVDAILDRAGPFYYSWSPDGRYMLWHQNSSLLGIFDTETGVFNELPDHPGSFQAPGWSPVDDRLLFAIEDDSTSNLSIATNEERVIIGADIEGTTFFLWSPDGTKIAHASGDYPLHNLTITNSITGQLMQLDVFDELISYFWSPDSSQLAVVTVEPYLAPLPEAAAGPRWSRPVVQQDDTPSIVLAWWLVDAETGDARRLTQFLATPDQFYMFQYFDQYAQSHQLWSPDSRYLAYAQLPFSGGEPEIILLDTSESSSRPVFLIPGLQAVFSFSE